MGENFDRKLVRGIEEALHDALGHNSAKAVLFYVDPHIAVENPNDYALRLQAIFGAGADVIIEKIENRICDTAGMPKRSWASMEECIETARNSLRMS